MSSRPSKSGSIGGETAVDAASFEQVVRQHTGWMLNVAENLLGDRSLAEDVVQEAFISAYKGLAEFRGDSSLKTWLHRITSNTAISKLRKLNRLAEQSIDEFLPVFDDSDCRIERPWTRLASLAELLETDDIRSHVQEAIGKLPESHRVVVYLRDIEGYDTRETAELLNISADNVKVRLHRARAALKHILEPLLRSENPS